MVPYGTGPTCQPRYLVTFGDKPADRHPATAARGTAS